MGGGAVAHAMPMNFAKCSYYLGVSRKYSQMFTLENPIKMNDDWGYPYGLETSILVFAKMRKN